MDKYAFMFPGQGIQFVEMGKLIYKEYAIARKTFQELEEVANVDIKKLCFDGTISELSDFSNMQLAIFATEVATYRAFMSCFGIKPQFIVGHSIGEFAALVAAGVITLQDAVNILKKRGKLVKHIIDKELGYMAIVENCSAEMIHQCITVAGLQSTVFISCYNTGSQYAISGLTEGMETLAEKLICQGARVTPVFNSPPMHCSVMFEIASEFKEYLEHIEFFPSNTAVITNYSGKLNRNKNEWPEILSRQLWNPVRFDMVPDYFRKYGIVNVIEMSPKKLLCNFIVERCPEVKTYCFGVQKDKLFFEEYMRTDMYSSKANFCDRCLFYLELASNHSKNAEEYQMSVQLYKRLLEIRKKNEEYSDLEKHEILQKMQQGLMWKGLDEVEIKSLVKKILDETNMICFK